MKKQGVYAPQGEAISDEQLKEILSDAFSDFDQLAGKKVLLLVPDYSRYHSNAGRIANLIYHMLEGRCHVDLLPTLGSHQPMTTEQIQDMYGDIPLDRFLVHNWRTGTVKIGEIPADFVRTVSDGIMDVPIDVEVSKFLYDGYALIVSIGQVVPHEVVGMANHTKNIFVGCGGSSMISASHILGAFYGMERMMGRDKTPVRRVFDYAAEKFLNDLPIWYILTVNTAPEGNINMHGVFIDRERDCFEKAVALAQQKNMTFLKKSVHKMVVMMNPDEFKSTWIGNKAIYRTRMAIEDGGELIILAPGIEVFGEDEENDRVIRKYGYCGREKVIELCKTQPDLQNALSAAAHLIHGSTDGRFKVTYCTRHLTREEVENANFNYIPYDEAIKRYDPNKLKDGFNTLPDGEEIFYVANPALGLWADERRYQEQ